MVQVKFFMHSNPRVLEDEINQWLEDNSYISFRDIKYGTDKHDYHYAIIIYMIEK